MKSKKILLLALVFMLALLLVACKTADEQEEPAYFVFEEDTVYNNVTQLKGDFVGANTEYNLIALSTLETDTDNTQERTITVYNAEYNTIVGTFTQNVDKDTLSVEVELSQYPIIRFTEIRSVQDGTEEDYTYYLVTGKDSWKNLDTDIENSSYSAEKTANMYLCRVDDTLYWVNKGLKIVRTETLDVSNSYTPGTNYTNYFGFKAEYKNYLYAWSTDATGSMVAVYDPNGVCCAMYKFAPGTLLSEMSYSPVGPQIYVLNNGNVLIQEAVIADDDATEWDYSFMGENLNLNTKIMDYKTGKITEVDCDFVVLNLESAYARDDDDTSFMLKPAGDYNNMAHIVKVANGKLSGEMNYVVLNNSLKCEYTLKNDYLAKSANQLGIFYTNSYFISNADKDGYIAPTIINGNTVVCRFNYEGEIVKILSDNIKDGIDGFYYTDSGIYTMDGELAFDFESSIFKGYDIDIYSFENKIAVRKRNYEADCNEVYIFVPEERTFKLFAGDKTEIHERDIGDGYVIVYNTEKETSTLYNPEETVLLVVNGPTERLELNDAVIVGANVDGKTVIYVINTKAAN